MILLVDVEKWLFVNKQEADAASVPTILVEKDSEGAKRFTSMRILFQLKKWTGERRFIPILSCDEAAYRAYEVFHVDAKPSMALLDRGQTLLIDNEKDSAYSTKLIESGHTSTQDVMRFAIEYIEGLTGDVVVVADSIDCTPRMTVPESLYDEKQPLDSGRRLFEWAKQQEVKKESPYE